MKIKDIMTKEVKTISPDMNAKEALRLLEQMEISGLPVVDQSGKLVGMFTEKDFLSYVLPGYIQTVGKFVYENNPKAARKKVAQLADMQVAQLMRKDVVTVNEDAALCEVARIMLTQKARRVPVLDSAGKMVGIAARCDVVKAMAREE